MLFALAALLGTGCGLFKKKCDCPRFGSVEKREKRG